MSKREVKELIARRYPKHDPDPDPARVRPVTAELSKLELTVPNTLLEVIEDALNLDSHIDPSRDMVTLLERAMAGYVKQRKRAKFAVVDQPRKRRDEPTQRVPAEVLRTAYERSGGQCEYRATDGTRCSSRVFLEGDHIVPRAAGGGHDELRILCRSHNQFEAEKALGRELMDRKRRQATVRGDVVAGLRQLGFCAPVAREATEAAIEALGPDAAPEAVIKEAVRLAPKPRGALLYRPATNNTRSRAREAPRPWIRIQRDTRRPGHPVSPGTGVEGTACKRGSRSASARARRSLRPYGRGVPAHDGAMTRQSGSSSSRSRAAIPESQGLASAQPGDLFGPRPWRRAAAYPELSPRRQA